MATLFPWNSQMTQIFLLHKSMKNVPNIGAIHLLSGHLHGVSEEGNGGEREGAPLALLGWQRRGGMTCDSCDSADREGGMRLAAPPDPITPHGPLSDPAAWLQPLRGQYWSLVRRTSCLPFTIQYHWTFQPHPHLPPPASAPPGILSSHPSTLLNDW